MPTTRNFEQVLRGAALRVTRPRLAVLSAVNEHPHSDTASIIGFVRDDLGEVSHQAVYDVLRALTGAIADVDCAVGEIPCLTPSDNHGFAIDEAEVVYRGRCPECVAAHEKAR